jgi:hypothetical protein
MREIAKVGRVQESAMVTSTSTPGSIVIEVICLTTSGELKRSITRLWTRSSNLSHVLVPANQKPKLTKLFKQKSTAKKS